VLGFADTRSIRPPVTSGYIHHSLQDCVCNPLSPGGFCVLVTFFAKSPRRSCL
jgi:hypothetical protein